MNADQNQTHPDLTPQIEAAIQRQIPLEELHQLFIDYRALGGLVYDGSVNTAGDWYMRKMTVTEFATRIGINRETLYAWQRTIPQFWERVNDRRRELAPQSRLAAMHDMWYLKAKKFDNWPLTEAWLRNNDANYIGPTTKKQDDNTNGWANLFAKHSEALEGEIADGKPADNA